MAARDDTRRAVLFGEISERPHGVQLTLYAVREAKGAVDQLIAMKRLSGLFRVNFDHLRQMKLELLAIGTKHLSGGVEHQGVHGKLVERLRAGNQTPGPLRAVPSKVVTSDFGHFNKGLEFGVNRVQQRCRNEITHDDTPVLLQNFHNIFSGSSISQLLNL